MIKHRKIKHRLILTYTILLSFFSVVMLVIFFTLFNKQAHVIHGEKMKEQGDIIADILMKEEVIETEKNESELSHHERMRRRSNLSNTNDYLSLVSKLSTDDIYIVDGEGKALTSTSMMSHKEGNQLTPSGNEILKQLQNQKSSVFFDRNQLVNSNQLGYGVPIIDENKEVIGAVIILSDNENYFLGLGKDYDLLIWSILVALLATALIAVVIAKKFVKPIHQMSDFTEDLIEMNYDGVLDIKTKDELFELGNKLSVLSSRLKVAKNEQDNKETNQKLFLSQISHELRTPVMVIQNSLEALAGDFLNETEKKEYIETLLSETEQLNVLVNDLLELSRLQITEFSITKEKVDITQVVEDSIRSYRRVLKEKKQEILFTTDLTEEDQVTGDYQRLLQLIKILIDNSLKYSTSGSPIYLKLYKKKNRVEMEIVNQTVENLEKIDIYTIFEPFNRGEQQENDGHGLGLTIAAQIVSRHNGRIEMSKVEPNKIKVSVSIPK